MPMRVFSCKSRRPNCNGRSRWLIHLSALSINRRTFCTYWHSHGVQSGWRCNNATQRYHILISNGLQFKNQPEILVAIPTELYMPHICIQFKPNATLSSHMLKTWCHWNSSFHLVRLVRLFITSFGLLEISAWSLAWVLTCTGFTQYQIHSLWLTRPPSQLAWLWIHEFGVWWCCAQSPARVLTYSGLIFQQQPDACHLAACIHT